MRNDELGIERLFSSPALSATLAIFAKMRKSRRYRQALSPFLEMRY